ncbi:glycosyltransferase family 2 protein [Bacteroidales bacterium SW299]|nr:glycosyltransferase family 2 protein [Bacteroidales bacterium SW299]
MVKVSIVVPIYNTEKYLQRCLESIERQTIDSYEVLLVNDGSTDSSKEICESFIRGKKEYRLINKLNGGLTSARCCGWKEAAGEYIVFVDSDDYIEAAYCEELYEACTKGNCNLAICGYNTINDNGYIRSYTFYDDIMVLENIKDDYVRPMISYAPKEKYNIPGFLWVRMMKRDCILTDCFVDENTVFSEDIVFNLEYARQVNKIAIVHKPLYNYFMSTDSLTRKYRPNLWGMYRNLHEYCTNYCQEEKISGSKIRLDSMLLGGMLRCIHQTVYFKYKFFQKEFAAIRKDTKTKEMLHSLKFLSKEYNSILLNYRLAYCMVRFIPSVIVYFFYKWRLN